MNNKIDKLIKAFAKLPRVGGRAAQRIVLALLQDKTGKAAALAAALIDAVETVRPCEVCGCLTDSGAKLPPCGGVAESCHSEAKADDAVGGNNSKFVSPPTDAQKGAVDSPAGGEFNSPLCEFCRDASRANGQLCIVRDLGDVWTIEKSGVFRGRYHVIGGLLSGAAGTMPEELNIANLPMRIKNENITEIIFTLPNTMEGKTTQNYIANNVQSAKCKVQFAELASGVPLGGDLDYIDDGTLGIAFSERKTV